MALGRGPSQAGPCPVGLRAGGTAQPCSPWMSIHAGASQVPLGCAALIGLGRQLPWNSLGINGARETSYLGLPFPTRGQARRALHAHLQALRPKRFVQRGVFECASWKVAFVFPYSTNIYRAPLLPFPLVNNCFMCTLQLEPREASVSHQNRRIPEPAALPSVPLRGAGRKFQKRGPGQTQSRARKATGRGGVSVGAGGVGGWRPVKMRPSGP